MGQEEIVGLLSSENGGREGGEAAAGVVVHNRARDVDFGEKKTCVDMG